MSATTRIQLRLAECRHRRTTRQADRAAFATNRQHGLRARKAAKLRHLQSADPYPPADPDLALVDATREAAETFDAGPPADAFLEPVPDPEIFDDCAYDSLEEDFPCDAA